MAKKINTTPIYPRPPQEKIDDAKLDARTFKEFVSYESLIRDSLLVRYLLAGGHSRDAAMWAIHELCSEGKFNAYGVGHVPKKMQNWPWVDEARPPSGITLATGVVHIDDGKTDWNYLWFVSVPNRSPVMASSRSCFHRDHTMLEWYKNKKSGVAKSPAKIRDKWNSENPDDSVGKGRSGADVVRKAINKAKSES